MKININPVLKGKLDFLSSNYDFEVGGYLTGYVKDGQVYLDDLLIPNQSLSKSHVEITAYQQLELRQKFGDKVKQILGHWHSHNSLGCFWSQTDLDNMNNLSLNRDFFVFIVSSKNKHLVDVYLKKPFNHIVENCELNSYDQSIKEVELFVKELEKQNEHFLKEEVKNNEELLENEENVEEDDEDDNNEENGDTQTKLRESIWG